MPIILFAVSDHTLVSYALDRVDSILGAPHSGYGAQAHRLNAGLINRATEPEDVNSTVTAFFHVRNGSIVVYHPCVRLAARDE